MSTTIQWTDETWNPTTGCTRISEGCRHCYIERTPAFRMAGKKFVNGATGVLLHPDRLEQPLHWKKPRRVFVNSLSDLFHQDIPDDFIADVFITMWAAGQHTFQILTKRPERMLQWTTDWWAREQRKANPNVPYKNVWLGVSVEDQATADERIPLLLQTPAAVRFISAEPLLGPVSIKWYLERRYYQIDHPMIPALDWVICGGESGPGARPCDLAWIRSMRDQCQAAKVPVFVKQLGANVLKHAFPGYDDSMLKIELKDKKGGDPEEWPEDLRVREYP